MGGGTESKKQQLGKIMLQQRVVAAEDLERENARRGDSGAPLARPDDGKTAAALRELAERTGLPSVDLAEHVIPSALLRLVPLEMAREHLALPFASDGERLSVAMADPSNAEVLEELAFIAAKQIVPHVCLPVMIENAVEHAYAGLAAGREQYVGAYVADSQLAALGLTAASRAPDAMPLETPPAPAEQARAHKPSEPPELDTAFSERTRPSIVPEVTAPDPAARILLAIGDAALRERLRGALAERGMTVLEAADGAQALEHARTQAPKVVLLEIDLDAIHGLDVIRRLRATGAFAELPIMVLADGPRVWRLRADLAESFGVTHCYAKPLDGDRLARAARMLVTDPAAPVEVPALSPSSEALWNAAMEAFHAGDLDQAIAQLQAGVEREPDVFELRYHLGLLYGRRDNPFAAIRALERAIALQPGHFSALKNLAVVYQRAGFRNTSIDVWQQAMSVAPDDETRDAIREHMLSLL